MSEWWLEPPFLLLELRHAHVDGLLLALDHDVLAPLATTFPCAYELTAHINPQSDHAGRLGGIIRMVARATDLPPTRHGWHHGASRAARKVPRRTNPDTPTRPRWAAGARFRHRKPCRAPISGAACAISPGNPSLRRSSRPSSPPAPPRMSSGRHRCAG